MRLLVVSNMYPGSRAPHYGVFVGNYVRYLAGQRDVDVRVASITDPAKGTLRTPIKYAALALRIVGSWLRFRPNVVHCHYAIPGGLPVALLGRLTRTPYVVTIHGGDVYEMPRRLPLGDAALRYVVDGASHVVAVGFQLADDLRRELGPDLPLSVINMGVDLERFEVPETGRREMRRLAYVGLLIGRKGVDLLLDAVACLDGDETTLDLYGAGPLEGSLRKQAVRLGLGSRVQMHGVVDQTELPRRLEPCGILVVPSRREPLGLVALEGMAMGMVVVAARVGGLAELVDDGRNGLLFEPDDSEALATALARAQALSGADLVAMRAAAAETARSNSAEEQAAKNLALLRRVCRL